MGEIKGNDSREQENFSSENFQSIKPENGMNVLEAKMFTLSLFEMNIAENPKDENWGGQYNDSEILYGRTLDDGTNLGEYEGERGDSRFIPSAETERGQVAIDKLKEYDLDGIEYKNAEPNFSKCSEGTIKIDNMTEHRYDYYDLEGNYCEGNFSQADEKLAEKWNDEKKDGRDNWNADDVEDYRHEHRLSWHERCDTETMDLVPFEIHSFFSHSGGCSECKVRDNGNYGGGFDE